MTKTAKDRDTKPDKSASPEDSKAGDKGGWLETVRTIVYALLIAFFVRTVAYQPFNIPSESMVPTLLEGDYLFVSKFSYGYSRYSLPLGLRLFSGRIFGSAPERGDVAVFRHPPDDDIDFIKRIVGLPGDRIQMIGGVLHINGEPVDKRPIEDPSGRGIPTYLETLPNGRSYVVQEVAGDNGDADNTKAFVVPPKSYFAMGDNRDNSSDSRKWLQTSFVPDENLIGRAEILFFSTDGTAGWFKPWRWPTATRFSRILKTVD